MTDYQDCDMSKEIKKLSSEDEMILYRDLSAIFYNLERDAEKLNYSHESKISLPADQAAFLVRYVINIMQRLKDKL